MVMVPKTKNDCAGKSSSKYYCLAPMSQGHVQLSASKDRSCWAQKQ
jgi:hypothetical protein